MLSFPWHRPGSEATSCEWVRAWLCMLRPPNLHSPAVCRWRHWLEKLQFPLAEAVPLAQLSLCSGLFPAGGDRSLLPRASWHRGREPPPAHSQARASVQLGLATSMALPFLSTLLFRAIVSLKPHAGRLSFPHKPGRD